MKKYLLGFLFVIPFIIGVASAQTVYVTNSGKKYHLQGCTYLKSKNAIDLSEAKSKGYSACSKCNPKNSIEIETDIPKSIESEPKPKEIQKPASSSSKGYEIHTGPNGGKYHYSKSGKKVYERK